jgi:dTDP-4-amino-4,6-dideoxygalactose transaminase
MPDTGPLVYLSPPHMTGRERALLLEAFDSNWIAPVGPDLAAFEAEFSKVVDVPHCVALSSGTAALHLALDVVGVRPGDDVLVSDLTFVATANAVSYTGSRPTFVDSDERSWNMDPDLLEAELRERARSSRLPAAVVVVDIYGQCADYGRIAGLCRSYDIPLVADAAESLGATYDGRPAGSLADVSIFSFNGNKIITTGGGGMLVSHSADLVARARHLSTQAREPATHYEHVDIGFNYRMSNLLAAIGRGQLEALDARVAARHATFDHYAEAFAGVDGIETMPVADYGVPSHWLTVITIDEERFGAGPDAVRVALAAERIESRPSWKPMHLQPAYRDCRVIGGAVSERIFATGLCLPSGGELSEADQALVIDVVLDTPRRDTEARR